VGFGVTKWEIQKKGQWAEIKMGFTLDDIHEIVINKDYRPFTADIRSQIIEDFGERAVGKMKKNRVHGIIQIDDNLYVFVGWGGIGYVGGFAVSSLTDQGLPFDYILALMQESGTRFWLRQQEYTKQIRSKRMIMIFEPLIGGVEPVLSKILVGGEEALERLEKFVGNTQK
jgi:hypothetical protein